MKRKITVLLATIGFTILILDSKTALIGAKEGIELCLSTVVPSLFPFFVFSTFVNTTLLGVSIPSLAKIGRMCKIPHGTETVLLIGLLGGYPVGAKTVTEGFTNGIISEKTARRMLGFCNNCGPAFIFGLCGTMFTSKFIPWILWLTQIISAISTGMLLPEIHEPVTATQYQRSISLTQALKTALQAMTEVCGWVILFKVILTLLSRWILRYFPSQICIILSGMLELTNGCLLLRKIPSEPLRFFLCNCFLSFGGLCVLMQTCSVTRKIGLGFYLTGKFIQVSISCILSIIWIGILYSSPIPIWQYFAMAFSILIILCIKQLLSRKKVALAEIL